MDDMELDGGRQRGAVLHRGRPILAALCFPADYIPGLVDITIGSLDDPSQPVLHYWIRLGCHGSNSRTICRAVRSSRRPSKLQPSDTRGRI